LKKRLRGPGYRQKRGARDHKERKEGPGDLDVERGEDHTIEGHPWAKLFNIGLWDQTVDKGFGDQAIKRDPAISPSIQCVQSFCGRLLALSFLCFLSDQENSLVAAVTTSGCQDNLAPFAVLAQHTWFRFGLRNTVHALLYKFVKDVAHSTLLHANVADLQRFQRYRIMAMLIPELCTPSIFRPDSLKGNSLTRNSAFRFFLHQTSPMAP
jgi:hypothetical protein